MKKSEAFDKFAGLVEFMSVTDSLLISFHQTVKECHINNQTTTDIFIQIQNAYAIGLSKKNIREIFSYDHSSEGTLKPGSVVLRTSFKYFLNLYEKPFHLDTMNPQMKKPKTRMVLSLRNER